MKPNLEDIELANLDQTQEQKLRELEQTFNSQIQKAGSNEIYLLAFKRQS